MGDALTDCVVSRTKDNGKTYEVVIKNPTSAEIVDEFKTTMHVIVTGGTVTEGGLVNNGGGYRIQGKQGKIDRDLPKYICKKTTSPYRFNK
jgi:hypothetical protein